MLKKFFLCCLVLFLSFESAGAFELKRKQKAPKPKKDRIRMVETEDEWKESAQNIPLSEREFNPGEPPKTTKTYYQPAPKYRFEKYNFPQGTKEINLEKIKKEPMVFSDLVADINCRYVAYSQFYYAPDIKQLSSDFFIAPLDTNKIKTKRMSDFNPNSAGRIKILESGSKMLYPYLFNSLTLVDWNQKSNKLIIKEKIGSMINGIYKTVIYVHILEDGLKGYTLKLEDLDSAIRDYYLDFEEFHLEKYNYELCPLGFSGDNDDLILLHCYLYDKDNKRIFMGLWGYNTDTYETLLISRDNPVYDVATNGLILKQVVE